MYVDNVSFEITLLELPVKYGCMIVSVKNQITHLKKNVVKYASIFEKQMGEREKDNISIFFS